MTSNISTPDPSIVSNTTFDGLLGMDSKSMEAVYTPQWLAQLEDYPFLLTRRARFLEAVKEICPGGKVSPYLTPLWPLSWEG